MDLIEKIKQMGATIAETKLIDVYDITGNPEVLRDVANLLIKEDYVNDSDMFGGIPKIIGEIRMCQFDEPGFLAIPANHPCIREQKAA